MPDPKPARPAPEATGAHVTQCEPPAVAPEGDILAGTPYRVIGNIGAGGMGTVLEAEHRALGKRVVVKLLLPKYANEPRLVERLKREARILGHIASPHIVAVSDLGQTASGATYVVMERLHGRTLGRELKTRQFLPVLEAVGWTRQVLAALSAAHRAGVVHRDIKLDNIFLCDPSDHEPRRIKLLDFGIAKLLKEATRGMDPSRHEPTADGTLLGSPRWLAPEQAMGKSVDGRTDIYAVGLLLYTLVAGRGPFSHIQDPIESIQASLRDQPALPSCYAPQEIPAALNDAIMMAIEKAPEHRFQTAEAFSTALESIAHELSSWTQPLPAKLTWQPIAATPPPSVPSADDARESTAPTLVCEPAGDAAQTERRERTEPTIALAGAAREQEGAQPAASHEERGLRVGPFVALTAASTLVFSVILALLVHLAGGR